MIFSKLHIVQSFMKTKYKLSQSMFSHFSYLTKLEWELFLIIMIILLCYPKERIVTKISSPMLPKIFVTNFNRKILLPISTKVFVSLNIRTKNFVTAVTENIITRNFVTQNFIILIRPSFAHFVTLNRAIKNQRPKPCQLNCYLNRVFNCHYSKM